MGVSKKELVKAALRDYIKKTLSGHSDSGENYEMPMPSKKQVAEENNVYIHTVTAAYNDLITEGLIVDAGRRWLIVKLPTFKLIMNDERFVDKANALGYPVVAKNFEAPGVIDANKDVAEFFQRDPGARVIRRIRVESLYGRNIRTTMKYYLEDVIPPEHLQGMIDSPAYKIKPVIFEKYPLAYMRQVTRNDRVSGGVLGAIFKDEKTVMTTVKVNFTKDDLVTFVSFAYHHPDYFQQDIGYYPQDEPKPFEEFLKTK